MAFFSVDTNNLLKTIRELPFKLEKELQSLTEKNLKTVFGLDFVKSEFSLNNFRIDTFLLKKANNNVYYRVRGIYNFI